jgi:tetratricopeptide (TPR) repeat protein
MVSQSARAAAKGAPPPHSSLLQLLRLYESGAYKEALDLSEELSASFEPVSAVWQVRGAVLDRLGDHEAALVAKERALQIAPEDARAMNNLGNSYHRLGRFEEACALYRNAISLEPSLVEAFSSLGATLSDMARFAEAETVLRQGLALDPKHVSAWRNLGNVLRGLGRLHDAIDCYLKCLAIDPAFSSALINLTAVYFDLGDFSKAEAVGREAIALAPESFEAFSNFGNVLHELGQLNEAEAVLRRSIGLNSSFAASRYNLGNVLFDFGRFAEAKESYLAAIMLSDGYAEARFNLGMLDLLQGEFLEGYEGYNYRFISQKSRFLPERFKPFPGRPPPKFDNVSVAVFWEQGLGDSIQFLQLLPIVRGRASHVTFFCQPKLVRLLSSSRFEGIDVRSADSYSDTLTFDVCVSLLSVPWLLGMDLSSFVAGPAYLRAEPDRVQRWSELVDQRKVVVGFCWQGSTAKIDKGRSVPLSMFSGLLTRIGCQFVSLHKGEGECQLVDFPLASLVTTPGDDFDNGRDAFLDTAALMMSCDLVVTTDTAVSHLAGALGVPVWLLLKRVPDWRWGFSGDRCRFYPSMRIFRQQTRGNWEEMFLRVESAFDEFLGLRAK